jgi:hypothetical protein
VPRERADRRVVENAQAGKRLDDLERARDAEAAHLVRPQPRDRAAVEANVPGRRPMEPGHEVEERGLPRPVRADDPAHLAPLDGEIDARDGEEAAEALRQPSHLEQRHVVAQAYRGRHDRRARRHAPASPPGRNVITRTGARRTP